MTALQPRRATAGRLTATRPPSVLVVDDDDTLRTVLARELRKRGFDVYSTGSGAEAVEMYCRSSTRIDVILMDVNLPGMSGPETLDAILAVDPFVRCCFNDRRRPAGKARRPPGPRGGGRFRQAVRLGQGRVRDAETNRG